MPKTVSFWLVLLLASPVEAYTHFIEKDAQGKITVAHWPAKSLPLLFSVDDEKLDFGSALAIAREAAILWKQVPGSAMTLQIEQLPLNIDENNFDTQVKFNDRRHEIIIEQKGKLLQKLGLDPEFVAGVGLPITKNNPKGSLRGPFFGEIIDAFVIVNTRFAWDPVRMRRILTHELGHALGLGHTNVAHPRMLEELPVMFFDPTQQEGEVLLHADDRAGLAALYPAKEFESLYGALQGTIFRVDRKTPAFGVNVFATSPQTGPIGTWTDEKGRFHLSGLPPARYALLFRALDGTKLVRGMKPEAHVGGLWRKATMVFCPEYYNDNVFTQCRLEPSYDVNLGIKAGQTRSGIVVHENRGNRTPFAGCILGSAPQLPNKPHGLGPLPQGRRGEACPSQPEPRPEPRPEPIEPTAKPEKPPETASREDPVDLPDAPTKPICGCQTDPGVALWGLGFLVLLMLRRRAR